jgi:hypothetical protein
MNMPTEITYRHEFDEEAKQAGRSDFTETKVVDGNRNEAGDRERVRVSQMNRGNVHRTITVIKTEEVK